MVDISITASQVQPGSNVATKSGIAGGTITAGMPVYLDSSDNQLKPADADNSEATAAVVGIALHGASDGQPLEYQSVGNVTLGAGASLTVGEIYVLSGTAGGIAPEGDLATSDYVTVLGVATSASVLKLGIIVSGVQVPA